mgnify:CR=1 FL=1
MSCFPVCILRLDFIDKSRDRINFARIPGWNIKNDPILMSHAAEAFKRVGKLPTMKHAAFPLCRKILEAEIIKLCDQGFLKFLINLFFNLKPASFEANIQIFHNYDGVIADY